MQQIYRLLCNFIEIALWHGCSPVKCRIFSEHLFLRAPLDGCFWLVHDSNSFGRYLFFSHSSHVANTNFMFHCKCFIKKKSLTTFIVFFTINFQYWRLIKYKTNKMLFLRTLIKLDATVTRKLKKIDCMKFLPQRRSKTK